MKNSKIYKLSKLIEKQGKILYHKAENMIKYYKQNFVYGRWLAFIAAVVSLGMLTSGAISLQWIGWSISCGTCLAWAYFAKQDKDTPRMLMEICFFLAAGWGVYNWIGQI